MTFVHFFKKSCPNYTQEDLDYYAASMALQGDLDGLKYLLTSPKLKMHANISKNDYEVFRLACGQKHLKIVKYLLTSPDLKHHANIHASNDDAFRHACLNGDLDMIMYLSNSPDLKEHANIHVNDNEGFKYIAEKGSVYAITYFLSLNGDKCIDFQKTEYNLDWALQNAIKYNDNRIVIAMMENLKRNNFMVYVEALEVVKNYDSHIYQIIVSLPEKEEYCSEGIILL